MHFLKNELGPAIIILKTSNLSVDNLKKYSTSMGQHLSPRYSQVILVKGYSVLTALSIDHNKDVQYQGAPGLPNYYL